MRARVDATEKKIPPKGIVKSLKDLVRWFEQEPSRVMIEIITVYWNQERGRK